MSRNTALVTDAAKVAAQSDLDDYAAGAAAHMGGDWAGHRQLNIVAGDYSTPAGILATLLARMQLTDDAGVTVAVVAPALFVSNASSSVPPVIVIEPADIATTTGQPASFMIYAASPLPMTFQWQSKLDILLPYSDIDGAVQSTYLIVAAAAADAGLYRCVVSNSQGSVTSAAATLTVST